ncbi:hypothetical protein GCM10011315_17590 [Roseovarius pacificus]|nr:hypothetical protein GCM10011315_17590 [Roseovarius pacificus]
MIDTHTALRHHGFQITIAEAIPTVPANSPKHDFTREMPPFEIVHSLILALKTDPNMATRICVCNRANQIAFGAFLLGDLQDVSTAEVVFLEEVSTCFSNGWSAAVST